MAKRLPRKLVRRIRAHEFEREARKRKSESETISGRDDGDGWLKRFAQPLGDKDRETP